MRIIVSAFMALVILLTFPFPVIAANSSDHKTYVIVVDKLSIDDIDDTTMPELTSLARSGAVGLASTRTLGSNNTENGAMTIGAGNLA